MPKNDCDWSKQAVHLTVEICVGKTWVLHKHMENVVDEEAAKRVAREALRDPSISAVRVFSNVVTHTKTAVHEERAGVVLRVPKSMKITSRKVKCASCAGTAVVASDGASDWAFCRDCGRALPLAS